MDVRDIPCPKCGAEPGKLCRTKNGNQLSSYDTHTARLNLSLNLKHRYPNG